MVALECSVMKACQLAHAFALLLGVAIISSFSVAAVAVPPGGLAATASDQDLILSFTTTSPAYYTVQTSSDLQQWTNSQGIAGDGTVKSLTMINALSGGRGFYRLSIQTPTRLLVPQSIAFAMLGHSCGGIQETVSAGLDVTSGYPTGVVTLSTRCGGSGRGGGYHTTTYTASVVVMWDFAGNVISAIPLTNGVVVNPTTGSDHFGDIVYNAGGVAYLVVPVPAAPTGVIAVQSGDQFQVSWMPNGANPNAVMSSTIAATPVNPTGSVLTTTVTGSATTGIIPTLRPQTTYQITVVSKTLGGSGPASTPINVTTSPATIPPSAPSGVTASWSNLDPTGVTDTFVATWQAADPGDSPVDQYLVTVTGSDGAGTFTQIVSGTMLSAFFTVDYIPSWSVTVQAHNAVGWGPVSAVLRLGGL